MKDTVFKIKLLNYLIFAFVQALFPTSQLSFPCFLLDEIEGKQLILGPPLSVQRSFPISRQSSFDRRPSRTQIQSIIKFQSFSENGFNYNKAFQFGRSEYLFN